MKKLQRTKVISLVSILTAVNMLGNLLVNYFPKVPGFGTPTFIYLLACVTGFALGPLYAPISMGLSDAIIALLFPRGVFNPLMVLSNAWLGFLCAVIYRKFKLNFTIRHFIVLISVTLLFTYTINTFALEFYYLVLLKKPSGMYKRFLKNNNNISNFWAFYIFLVTSRVTQLFWIALNGVIAYPVLIRLKKIYPDIFVEKKLKQINKIKSSKINNVLLDDSKTII